MNVKHSLVGRGEAVTPRSGRVVLLGKPLHLYWLPNKPKKCTSPFNNINIYFYFFHNALYSVDKVHWDAIKNEWRHIGVRFHALTVNTTREIRYNSPLDLAMSLFFP